jgi:ADP-ribose pyrophosphatase
VEKKLSEDTLNSKTVYSGNLVEVVEDTIHLPNGTLTVRETVKHRGVVAMIPVIDEAVITVRQFRYACGKTLLGFPGDSLNPGEAPDEGASQELIEETGYVSGRLKRVLHFYVFPGHCSEQVYLYLATNLSHSVQDFEADEDIRVVKVDIATALHLIERNEIEDAKSIAGILYLTKYLRDP